MTNENRYEPSETNRSWHVDGVIDKSLTACSTYNIESKSIVENS